MKLQPCDPPWDDPRVIFLKMIDDCKTTLPPYVPDWLQTYEGGAPCHIEWLIGQLWNCTDQIPVGYAYRLNRISMTFASAARLLKRQWRQQRN